MSRQSTATARNLTLTEELEKLEQSITLTLQEIDHNFSRAHRIVTSSILPTVEQYAKHSEAVWEGSKFWKQFFEASANVSLTGYEEATGEDADGDGMYSEHITTAGSSAFGSRTATPVENSEGTGGDEDGEHQIDESLLSSPSVAHATSTPRLPGTGKSKGGMSNRPQFADYPSPYESLKREMQVSSSPTAPPPEPTIAINDPITPGRTSALPDMSMTPDSSPFVAPPATADRQGGTGKVNNDLLLHRVLDKNYRVAATPHTQRKQTAPTKSKSGTSTTAATTPGATTRFLFEDDLGSSPDVPAPQLREDLFSPAKVRGTTGRTIPGVSVQTPGAKRQIRKSMEARGRTPRAKDTTQQQTRDLFGQGDNVGDTGQGASVAQARKSLWDSDDDDGFDDTENDLGFSPPKTMQFHIPQSRILQTPAREASKRIVEDLLLTAGGDITDEFDKTDQPAADDSPSVVRRDNQLDDSF